MAADTDTQHDQRIRDWKRATQEVAESGMSRWHMLHALILADRGEARSKEAREIADALCMSWGLIEQRQHPIGVKR